MQRWYILTSKVKVRSPDLGTKLKRAGFWDWEVPRALASETDTSPGHSWDQLPSEFRVAGLGSLPDYRQYSPHPLAQRKRAASIKLIHEGKEVRKHQCWSLLGMWVRSVAVMTTNGKVSDKTELGKNLTTYVSNRREREHWFTNMHLGSRGRKRTLQSRELPQLTRSTSFKNPDPRAWLCSHQEMLSGGA